MSVKDKEPSDAYKFSILLYLANVFATFSSSWRLPLWHEYIFNVSISLDSNSPINNAVLPLGVRPKKNYSYGITKLS